MTIAMTIQHVLKISCLVTVAVGVLSLTSCASAACTDSPLCQYYSDTHHCELSPETTVDQCPYACMNPCLCDFSDETNDTECDCIQRAQGGHCDTILVSFGCDTTCALVHSVNCPPLPDPEDPNAHLSTEDTSYLTIVTEECNVGHVMTSYSNLGKKICLSTGDWFTDQVFGKSAECLVVDCGDPPSSFNAEVIADGSYYGHVANYSCVPNADPFSGQMSVMCGENGEWIGNPLTCAMRRCRGSPPTLARATYTKTGSLVGDTVTYTCDHGYTRQTGDMTLTCAEDQTWAGEQLVCQLVDCGPPPSPAHIQIDTLTTTYRSIANGTCQTGYLGMPEETILICDVSGVWVGLLPVCTAVDCGPPTIPAHSSCDVDNTTFGNSATYSCLAGYQRHSGDWTVTCDHTGTWSGDLIICVEKDCGPPSDRDLSHVTYTNTIFQSRAHYECDIGHEKVDGDVERECQADATWSGNALVCLPLACGAAPVYSGARQWSLSSSVQLVYGDQVFYECFYQEEGRENLRWSLTCDVGSQWTGEPPECGASSPVKLKTFVPEPLEAPGSWAVGFAIFGVLISFIVLFIIMDITTLKKHSKYMKANCIAFRKLSLKAWRHIRTTMAALKRPKQPPGDPARDLIGEAVEHGAIKARSVSSISANLPVVEQTTA